MKPANFEFGGGVNYTIMHPAVLVVTVVTILLVLLVPRKYVVIPFLLCVFLVPRGQQLYVAGMHWYVALRILMLVGLVRLARAKFQVAGGLNGIDKAFILWAICRGVCQVLLFPQRGMVIYQAAFWLQAFGGYFLLRYAIQDEEDIARAAKTLAVLAVILGACMLNEHLHHVNVFGYLGGAPITPTVRAGRIRAQAIFGHPILAGCFGATLAPLFYWLWKGGRSKLTAFLGVIGSTLCVFTSSSSTAVFAYVAGVGALFLWPIRRSMRAVRWGIVLTLVALALVMKEKVWFVIAHAKVIGSSDGYSRAMLVDNFFKHFRDWWLIGTNQTGNWGWDMWDLSNQFVAEGERGGLVTFICFITMISLSFRRLGKMRKQVEGDRKQEWFYWSLCAIMVAHVFAFFGVSYWDQMAIWWWAFLAMVSAATAPLQTAPARAESLAQHELPNAAGEEPAWAGPPP
jgi:hypothetical protein